jgi:hypothetical protein
LGYAHNCVGPTLEISTGPPIMQRFIYVISIIYVLEGHYANER